MRATFAFFGVAICIFSTRSFAASCDQRVIPTEKRAQASSLIFVGKIREELPIANGSKFNRKASLEVVQSFKGRPEKELDVFYFVDEKAGVCPNLKTMWSLEPYAKGRHSMLFYASQVDGIYTISRETLGAGGIGAKGLLAELRELDKLKIKYHW